jgi:phage tail-like protein
MSDTPTPLQLIVFFQGRLVQRLSLGDALLTIGRTPDNSLSLPHPQVARRHAELRLEGDQVLLLDLGSNSGTFIGETRLLPNQPQLLPLDTLFRIGPFELRYQVEVAEAEASMPAPGAEPVPALPVSPPRKLLPPRPSVPPLRPIGPISSYLSNLPAIYQDNDFLGRFLLIVEALWEPLEQRQDHLQMYFDPHTCPVAVLQYLSSWLDLQLDPFWSEAHQRLLLAEALELIRWRGTRYGLVRLIELVTGLTPEILDEPEHPYVMRVRLCLPPEGEVERELIENLVRRHKPAHIGYILDLR